MAMQLTGKKWTDLSAKQQKKIGSKQEFHKRRGAQRKAGEAMESGKNVYKGKLDDFDTRATGQGGAMKEGTKRAGTGKDRLSRDDLFNLVKKGGHSKQEVLDYAKNSKSQMGSKAQSLLNVWTNEIAAKNKQKETGGGGGSGGSGGSGTGTGTGTGTGGGGGGGGGGSSSAGDGKASAGGGSGGGGGGG